MKARISGVATYLPERTLTSGEVEAQLAPVSPLMLGVDDLAVLIGHPVDRSGQCHQGRDPGVHAGRVLGGVQRVCRCLSACWSGTADTSLSQSCSPSRLSPVIARSESA